MYSSTYKNTFKQAYTPRPNRLYKNRYIGENIFKLFNIIDCAETEDTEAMFVAFDFEKAFDNLNWDFIDKILHKFNFGESIRKWRKSFMLMQTVV